MTPKHRVRLSKLSLGLIVALAAAQLAELREEGCAGDALVACGHSVGEFSALHALGVVSAPTPELGAERTTVGGRPAVAWRVLRRPGLVLAALGGFAAWKVFSTDTALLQEQSAALMTTDPAATEIPPADGVTHLLGAGEPVAVGAVV